ncbi:alanine racemase [Candidatus Acetothermia bacterium]|jgi:alanine racemase|nr:alanine racemase [Candidatus Acetothermia bacterium]MCI2427415.1 alanine racemase [Candidatus Acetothermia bacterium]MCI2428734.1 alanine racemase [Candidatus Acetothermia bacterium]
MAQAKIDLGQLSHNIRLVRANLPAHVKILFTVKHDGYGHGLVEIAQIAQREGIDQLGVVDVREVERLRRAGIELPILVLGLSRREDITALVSLRTSITIADLDFAAQIDKEASSQRIRTSVHVVVETGMGRFGLFTKSVLPFFQDLQRFSHLQIDGIFSHLAVADSRDPADRIYTIAQIEKLNTVLDQLDREGILPPLRHIGATPALLQYPAETMNGYYNMMRLGAIFYGYSEVPPAGTWAEKIVPIATVITEIIDLRELPAGSYISYGRTYQTDSVRKIAVLPLGFGSGLHRGLSNCGEVIIGNQRAMIVGKICLDHTMVDVTGMEVKIGDTVEVISPRLTAQQQGDKAGIGLGEIFLPLCKQVERNYIKTQQQ